MNAYSSTHPFAEIDPRPAEILAANGITLRMNKFGRKITSTELAGELGNSEILIAGTENITKEVFEKNPSLKLISRVGIGLDNIDFDLCKKYGVRVAYTPDAPTIAVAEMCVGFMLELARNFRCSNDDIREGKWKRYMGMLLRGKTVGIFGMGRIGKSLIHLLAPFGVKFLVNEIQFDHAFARLNGVQFVSRDKLLENSDFVSVNIPLKSDTRNFITFKEIEMMKPGAFLINTARGGIVNEADLYIALKSGVIAGAAIDVYEEEPYNGNLKELGNCLLTAHMGAATRETRAAMELEAAMTAVDFALGRELKNEAFSNE